MIKKLGFIKQKKILSMSFTDLAFNLESVGCSFQHAISSITQGLLLLLIYPADRLTNKAFI